MTNVISPLQIGRRRSQSHKCALIPPIDTKAMMLIHPPDLHGVYIYIYRSCHFADVLMHSDSEKRFKDPINKHILTVLY